MGLLGGREQVVGPGDRIAERLMTSGEIARATGQQGQTVFQPTQERGGRQHAAPWSRELDREWKSIEAATDRDDVCRVVPGQRESGCLGAGALSKEGNSG